CGDPCALLPAVNGDGCEKGGFVPDVGILMHAEGAVRPKMDTQAMGDGQAIDAEQIAVRRELHTDGRFRLAGFQVEHGTVEMFAQVADAVWSPGDRERRITQRLLAPLIRADEDMRTAEFGVGFDVAG